MDTLNLFDMQIKVEHTKQIPTDNIVGSGPVYLTLAEGKLVLVKSNELPSEKAIGKLVRSIFGLQIWSKSDQAGYTTITGSTHIVNQIIISETEKIEVGDWIYDTDLRNIKQATELQARVANKGCNYYVKIIALPEHFSPEQLQMIVDGKLKDQDKVLIECEYTTSLPRLIDAKDLPQASVPPAYIEGYHSIKLNSSNHITLHKVEEKMYTREDILQILRNWEIERTTPYSFADAYGLRKWFEKNVK